jgi:uncharacterized protein (DUF433 family)
MNTGYVEKYEHGYRIIGSRVSLDSIVYAFRDGLSPETIAIDCFPTLSLEKVYGAIAYYLAHRNEVDQYLQESEKKYDSLRRSLVASNPEFHQKLLLARRQFQTNGQ